MAALHAPLSLRAGHGAVLGRHHVWGGASASAPSHTHKVVAATLKSALRLRAAPPFGAVRGHQVPCGCRRMGSDYKRIANRKFSLGEVGCVSLCKSPMGMPHITGVQVVMA